MYELPGTDSRERTLIELLSALLALCRLHFRSLHRPAWRDQAAVGISRGEMEHVKRPIGGNLAPAPSVAQDRSTASHKMTMSNAVRNRPVPVLYGLMLISLAGLMLLPPLLQNQGYHGFADQRTLFGIPNFWNVFSNLPFIAVGAAGLFRLRRDSVSVVLFSGIFLTGLGSSYYHLNPNDSTLFWDRLPMTLCFSAILAALVQERVNTRAGVILLRPLLAVGVFSLLLWRWTDDLRLYAWAQFFPLLTSILVLHLFPPKWRQPSQPRDPGRAVTNTPRLTVNLNRIRRRPPAP